MKFNLVSSLFLMVLGCVTAVAMQPQRRASQNATSVIIENLAADLNAFFTRDREGHQHQHLILSRSRVDKDYAYRSLEIKQAHEITIFTRKGIFEVSDDDGHSIGLYTYAEGVGENGIKIAKRVLIGSPLAKNDLKNGLQIVIEADNSVKLKKMS